MFDDVLKIVGLDDEDIKKVLNAGIKSFTNVKMLTKSQFTNELMAGGLSASTAADMEAFHLWYYVGIADL